MISDLDALAADLFDAAKHGAAEAGEGAVKAGALQAEIGLRTPNKAAGITVSGVGGLHARVGATQRRGVYQEHSPAVAGNVSTNDVAGTMANVAAELGVRAVKG